VNSRNPSRLARIRQQDVDLSEVRPLLGITDAEDDAHDAAGNGKHVGGGLGSWIGDHVMPRFTVDNDEVADSHVTDSSV